MCGVAGFYLVEVSGTGVRRAGSRHIGSDWIGLGAGRKAMGDSHLDRHDVRVFYEKARFVCENARVRKRDAEARQLLCW